MGKRFFRPKKFFKVSDIASLVGAKVVGDADRVIRYVDALDVAEEESISFFNNVSYASMLSVTKAGACFITQEHAEKLPSFVVKLVVVNPYLAFAKTLQFVYESDFVESFISEKSSIAKSAKIGANVYIGDNVVIGEHTIIGENTFIEANVYIAANVEIGKSCKIYAGTSIRYAVIGEHCIFHSNVNIGQDGFGFVPNLGGHVKIPQIGGVIIGDNVEVGAGTCIDRGTLKNTVVADGAKFDNMVQVAHNVQVGKHSLIAAGVCIGGSAIIEDYVAIGGNTGVAPHIVVGKGAQVAPMSGVTGSVAPGKTIIGFPAIEFRAFWKSHAIMKKLLVDYKKVFKKE